MPVFLHNLSGYDGHLILQSITKKYSKVRIVPTNLEKFMALQVGRVMFLDSMKFAGKSLDSLAQTLDDEDFIETKKMFGVPQGPRPVPIHHAHPAWEDSTQCEWCATNREEERIQQMFQKGIFPYDNFDSMDRLKETRLPERDKFYNKLMDKGISWKDERHAHRVWELQGCQTFRDYHDFYLKTDVTLLADFFEKFRNTCLNSYGLDAAKYFSTPGLAIDSALKVSGIELELLDNEESYSFFEQAVRGGISQISLRHAQANTPLTPDYNPDDPHVQLIYLDSNNLYGHAMSQPLPTGNFRWLEPHEIVSLDIMALEEYAQKGYALVK